MNQVTKISIFLTTSNQFVKGFDHFHNLKSLAYLLKRTKKSFADFCENMVVIFISAALQSSTIFPLFDPKL